MKIRLAMATVRPVHSFEKDGVQILRFGQIPGGVFDIEERFILNESINMGNEFVKIVTPEAVSFGLFHAITFTRDIELPR